jgi:transposase-like protein
MRLYDVPKMFSTEQECIQHLVNMRWPHGVRCVACNSDWVNRYDSQGKTGKFRRVYQCGDCGKQFTPMAGTLFQDSHLPLQKWFMAIALIAEAKKGMSAMQLQRALGVTYKTAWYLAHRIREAMQDGTTSLLSGIVEIDETYVGGKKKGKGVWEGRQNKTPVIGLRERNGKLRLVKTKDTKAATVRDIVAKHVSKDVQYVMTDDSAIYPAGLLPEHKEKHRFTIHSHGQYVKYFPDVVVHSNSVESGFSLLKRGIIGSFHHISVKHLHRYLHEFEWRFDRRKQQSQIHGMIVKNMTQHSHLPYKQLISNQ